MNSALILGTSRNEKRLDIKPEFYRLLSEDISADQATGAGLMGELNEFTAEWIEAALEKQNSCAGDAIQVGRKIRSYGGALEAIKAMVLWREERNGY